MTKTEGQSRNGRRMNTKAAMHKACQNKTKSIVRKARAGFTPRKRVAIELPLWNVRNSGTKREIQIRAATNAIAIDIALGGQYRLAKSAAKLTATQV